MRTVSADFNDVRGPHDKSFRRCVGGGHAMLGLREDYRKHLAAGRELCGFEYLRCHGLLHDDMGVCREDDNGDPLYGWQYVDAFYDSLLDMGVRPFVELSCMPKALASGDKTLFYWRANVTPPASLDKWGALISEAVGHWERRYGRDEVIKWYFEVWNEPDVPAFWTGNRDEYFALYRAAAMAVKGVCGDYRVGGPATSSYAWIPEMIDYCQANDVPLDFISSHNYGVLGDFDEHGTMKLRLDDHPEVFWGPTRNTRATIQASARPDLEFHITEWSTSYSARDPVHDSYLSPAFLLDKIKKCEGYHDSMSYWIISDICEELRPPSRAFHGGFGLINLQGLPKPAFFVYQFLNQLGDTELRTDDEDAWVCRSDRGAQVLLWDYTYLKQDAHNQVFFVRDLPAKPIAPAIVSLSGLAPGRYSLAVHRTGYRSNDVFADYLDLGCPAALTREETEHLRARNDGSPELVRAVTVAEDGALSTEVPMRENDVVLLTLTRGDGG